MAITAAILNYRRFLKRRNYSGHTLKNYMATLKQFVIWVDVPIEAVNHKKLLAYLDHLLDRGLQPKTINCHLDSIRGFYHYLIEEEQVAMVNPVKRGYALRLSRPLPRHLRDEEVERLLKVVHHQRDRAMVMLMLRCGLRVEEVARLKLAALDLRRSQVFVHQGKGAKDRVVYLSDDAYEALDQYLRVRPASRVKEVFLVDKGRCRGKAISVRGIQKRLEYYARQARLKVSCHQLRHTMATQLLNADAALVTIQDLLGHTRIKTTQRYCRVSNLKVQRDYYRAMTAILQTVWTVGRYLKRWGFTPQKPARRAWEQNPEQVRQWLKKEYPSIRRQAQKEKAQIYWGDEMGLRSDHAVGRSYGLKGQTPVILATGQRFRCNMISAITNQGRLNFMVFKERFTAQVFIEFLRRLLRQNDRRVYLIIDRHPVHRSHKVKNWVEENEARLRLIFLPSYSPEINPDELLNQDVKSNALGRQRPADQTELMSKVRSYLRSRQCKPDIVANYFQGKHVQYAA
jgi:site-specific recombinase XerD/transposase